MVGPFYACQASFADPSHPVEINVECDWCQVVLCLLRRVARVSPLAAGTNVRPFLANALSREQIFYTGTKK